MSNEKKNEDFEVHVDDKIYHVKVSGCEVNPHSLIIYKLEYGQEKIEAIFRFWDKMVRVKTDE